MGKVFFKYLEEEAGIYFGVADRFLIRKSFSGNRADPGLRELSDNAYYNLKEFGYDSFGFRRSFASYRKDEQNLVLEWRRKAKLSEI